VLIGTIEEPASVAGISKAFSLGFIHYTFATMRPTTIFIEADLPAASVTVIVAYLGPVLGGEGVKTALFLSVPSPVSSTSEGNPAGTKLYVPAPVPPVTYGAKLKGSAA
jgi:hypothetical protein